MSLDESMYGPLPINTLEDRAAIPRRGKPTSEASHGVEHRCSNKGVLRDGINAPV